ncbi:MAG: response regulator transcription factor, partial [Eggerthellaceae bacterium]|nr:response regulator transcription factor [Eggerthellaceae bacterium]
GGQSHAHSDAHAAPSAQNEEAFQILSRRERQVYVLLLEGKSNGEISAALNVSQNTVKTHVSRVFDKLNVNSRIELLRKALSA